MQLSPMAMSFGKGLKWDHCCQNEFPLWWLVSAAATTRCSIIECPALIYRSMFPTTAKWRPSREIVNSIEVGAVFWYSHGSVFLQWLTIVGLRNIGVELRLPQAAGASLLPRSLAVQSKIIPIQLTPLKATVFIQYISAASCEFIKASLWGMKWFCNWSVKDLIDLYAFTSFLSLTSQSPKRLSTLNNQKACWPLQYCNIYSILSLVKWENIWVMHNNNSDFPLKIKFEI